MRKRPIDYGLLGLIVMGNAADWWRRQAAIHEANAQFYLAEIQRITGLYNQLLARYELVAAELKRLGNQEVGDA